MPEPITKTILWLEDIQLIKPNFLIIKIIDHKTAQDAQIIVYDKIWKEYQIITTNQFSDLIKPIIEHLQENDYHTRISYTDEKSFEVCLKRYDDMEMLASQDRDVQNYRDTVLWNDALKLLQETVTNRSKYKESDFVTELLRLSFQSGASDMHRQSEYDWVHIRIRRDGVLQEILHLTAEEYFTLIQTIKYLSGVKLNIAVVPQDGRMRFNVFRNNIKVPIDVRVSMMPWLKTESVVMRFLDSAKTTIKMQELGFQEFHYKLIVEQLKRSSGMIIVTGPTGSWKTTTLYSMLNLLNNPSKKIITLEDPVEYEVPWIQQSQIQEDEGYTFEEWLRAVLRQDPDIVMVWEIRNKETAQIAINAALTWHLVLTTLHTNSAIETVDRLYNLGLPPYMIAQAINCIIGQRLVRKIVPWLSERPLTELESKELHDQQLVLWQKWITVDQKSAYPRWDGTHACYCWRLVVAEVFENTDEMKKLISWSNTTLDIQKKWASEWNISFAEDGYLKVLQGVTTLDEVHRVL